MASAYCTYCAVYGHFSDTCSNAPKYDAVEPVYIEQLIAPNLLVQHGITTKTPLPAGAATARAVPEKVSEVIEIPDNNMNIRAFLLSKGVNPAAKIKDNYKKMEKLATDTGKRVVYIAQ